MNKENTENKAFVLSSAELTSLAKEAGNSIFLKRAKEAIEKGKEVHIIKTENGNYISLKENNNIKNEK